MESALDVLSRAAKMVQDNAIAAESRLLSNSSSSSKELPTTKWRRERRLRLSAEYPSVVAGAPAPPVEPKADSPLDMSGKPPPPPYREPLPGSEYAGISSAAAPAAADSPVAAGALSSFGRPKHISIGHADTGAAAQPLVVRATAAISPIPAAVANDSLIDPVIDEHFRRSLGADYATLFGNQRKPGAAIKPTPIAALKRTATPSVAAHSSSALSQSASTGSGGCAPIAIANVSPTIVTAANAQLAAIVAPTVRRVPAPAERRIAAEPLARTAAADDVGMSVDDHFAKALGDTWQQLLTAAAGE